MRKKLVSVCIPVYNGACTIEGTLHSVLNQTYKNLEIIIVDNCSEDNTVQVINKFDDSRIKVYQNNANLGLAGNLNKCLEYVSGEYVQFVCADDILYPECIYKKVCLIESREHISMVFSASEIIDDTGKVLMKRRLYKRSCIIDGDRLAKRSYLSKNLYGEPSNVLFKAVSLAKAGKFASNLCYTIDWDMWLRLSCVGDVGYINKILVKYRISLSNVTSSIKVFELLKDDWKMINNMRLYGCINNSSFGHLVHHMAFILRMLARRMYMRLKCH